MGLHTLHREKISELKPLCYRDGLWDKTIHAIALYTMGDVHGAIVKCWPEIAGTLGSGRQTSECPVSPRSPPDLSVAGPVVPRDTGGITVQWPCHWTLV